MALVPCPDCAREVSTSALACPQCGRPGPFGRVTPFTPLPKAEPPTIRRPIFLPDESVIDSGASAMVCPHCKTKGRVTTEIVKRKKGVSGGKVMGALFTGGFSLLATGLSRKETMTHARCGKCKNAWDF